MRSGRSDKLCGRFNMCTLCIVPSSQVQQESKRPNRPRTASESWEAWVCPLIWWVCLTVCICFLFYFLSHVTFFLGPPNICICSFAVPLRGRPFCFASVNFMTSHNQYNTCLTSIFPSYLNYSSLGAHLTGQASQTLIWMNVAEECFHPFLLHVVPVECVWRVFHSTISYIFSQQVHDIFFWL